VKSAVRRTPPIITAAIASAAVVCAVTASRAAALSTVQPPGGESAAQTVWSGVYTADQAKRGESIVGRSCAKCHGADLTGGQDGPSLVGPETLQAWSTMTLGDLFDRIRTTMPADAPQSLSAQETADILAYTLRLNQCPHGENELAADRAALSRIRISSRPDAKQP